MAGSDAASSAGSHQSSNGSATGTKPYQKGKSTLKKSLAEAIDELSRAARSTTDLNSRDKLDAIVLKLRAVRASTDGIVPWLLLKSHILTTTSDDGTVREGIYEFMEKKFGNSNWLLPQGLLETVKLGGITLDPETSRHLSYITSSRAAFGSQFVLFGAKLYEKRVSGEISNKGLTGETWWKMLAAHKAISHSKEARRKSCMTISSEFLNFVKAWTDVIAMIRGSVKPGMSFKDESCILNYLDLTKLKVLRNADAPLGTESVEDLAVGRLIHAMYIAGVPNEKDLPTDLPVSLGGVYMDNTRSPAVPLSPFTTVGVYRPSAFAGGEFPDGYVIMMRNLYYGIINEIVGTLTANGACVKYNGNTQPQSGRPAGMYNSDATKNHEAFSFVRLFDYVSDDSPERNRIYATLSGIQGFFHKEMFNTRVYKRMPARNNEEKETIAYLYSDLPPTTNDADNIFLNADANEVDKGNARRLAMPDMFTVITETYPKVNETFLHQWDTASYVRNRGMYFTFTYLVTSGTRKFEPNDKMITIYDYQPQYEEVELGIPNIESLAKTAMKEWAWVEKAGPKQATWIAKQEQQVADNKKPIALRKRPEDSNTLKFFRAFLSDTREGEGDEPHANPLYPEGIDSAKNGLEAVLLLAQKQGYVSDILVAATKKFQPVVA
jgi:hypothetical protein